VDEQGAAPEVAPTPGEASRSRRDAVRAERAKAAKQRRTVLLSVLVGVLVVGAVFYLMWTRGADMFSSTDEPSLVAVTKDPVVDFPGPGGEPVQVTVAAETTPELLGATLVDAGVVSSVEVFTAAYAESPDAPSIAPGTYNVFRQMRAADAIAALLDPENLADLTVEVKAGLTVPEIKTELSRVTGVGIDQVDEAFADTASTGLPDEAGGRYEGWLAPGTYHFGLDSTPTQMLATMVSTTVETLDGLGVAVEDRVAVLTKASLVEKEGALPEDLAGIAAVIDNRLAAGTNLQRDSTVRYALGRPDDYAVTQADRQDPSEYNTFTNAGLPPSAISTVSVESLQAVLAPADSDAVYFLMVDPVTREIQFSDTYTEYQDSLKAYQVWLDANG